MKEEKLRNGIIKVLYKPMLETDGKLSRIGWFRIGSSGETIVFPSKPTNGEVYPLYLEIRSHRVFEYFVGKEIEVQGYLTINKFNEQIRSAHITPVNLQLLSILVDKLLYQDGMLEAIRLINKT